MEARWLKHLYNNRGFTLIEILMVLMLMSILTTVAVTNISESNDETRFEETVEEMLLIRDAMVGNPSIKTRGVRSDFGYVGDVGSIPSAIADLTTMPGGHTAWTSDNANRINHGWNGPYFKGSLAGADYTRDAWGNAYVYSPLANPPTLVSLGADGAAGGTGLNQDITLQIPANQRTATVNGFITSGGAGNPQNVAATVTLYHPDGTGALTTTTDNVIVGDQGYFSINNVPVGVRSATITIGATTYGPMQFTVSKNQYVVPLKLTDTDYLSGGGGGDCSGRTIQFQVASNNDAEDVGTTNIIVEASSSCTNDMTVDYATANGSAIAGTDYTATSGTLTINAGNTAENIPVTLIDNGTAEGSRNFTLTLTNPQTGPTLGTNTVHTFTINDDENPPITPIIDLQITDIGITQVDLGWTQASATPAITDFQIEYKKSTDTIWLTFVDGVSTSTVTTLTGLDAETEYNFRVKAYNGTWGPYSNIATGQTAPNDDFFDPTINTAFNLGGATTSAVVALEAGAVITLTNATYPTGTTLTTLTNAGDTHVFTSSLNDELSSDKEFFVAGRLGSGGDVNKGNMVWSTSSWAGTNFYFNVNRDNPHKLSVHAFADLDVTVYKGGILEDSQTLTAGSNHVFTLPHNGSYEVSATGLIIGFLYSNKSSRVVDPRPLLPASTSLLGVPSRSVKASTTITANNYNGYFSDSSTTSGTVNLGSTKTINPPSTPGTYQEPSLRIIADTPLVANSYADANGNCAAPFVPTSMLKYRFAINVAAKWVALASTEPGTVDMIAPGGGTTTITLSQSGAGGANFPYKARVTNKSAGHRFVSTNVRFQVWYEPTNDTGGSRRDETIMFGYD